MLLPFLMTGCVGNPVRTSFYILNPLAKPSGTILLPERTGAIGVGPVWIPKYLDRPQVVTRIGRNKVRINDLHQWAGPLKHDLARIVRENLSVLFEGHDAVPYPWRNSDGVGYQIKISIQRLDVEDRAAFLWADWSIRDVKSPGSTRSFRSRIEVPVSGPGYSGRVRGINESLNQFSYELAERAASFIADQSGSRRTGTQPPGSGKAE